MSGTSYPRGQQSTAATTGKRRLSKRNGSNPMLTTLNTSAAAAGNPNLSLRPSPASSRADGFALSPHSDTRSPPESRPSSKSPSRHPMGLPPEVGTEERPGSGLKKKISLTGGVLGKRASLRLGLGPMRSQSDVSLVESPEERKRVLNEIKEKAEKDRTMADLHVGGGRAPNHLHPVRRRSLLTPGLATRDASDPLRKPPVDGRIDRRPVHQPPATAPLARPPPSNSAAYRQPYPSPPPIGSAPLTRLAPLDLAGEDGMMGSPRSSTPSEHDYGRLGAALRITNGIASPNPSVSSGRWSNGSPVLRNMAPAAANENEQIRNFTPLKSRLYMIESVDTNDEEDQAHIHPAFRTVSEDRADVHPAFRTLDEVDESNIHPAFRKQPSSGAVSDSSVLAQEYQAELAESPYESSVDLNKPLPTPPEKEACAAPKAAAAEAPVHSRSKSSNHLKSKPERPDLEYRKRESFDGDLNGRQEHLYDETLSLLESIGSSRSNSVKPQVTTTTTTTTTTTFTSTTAPASVSISQGPIKRELPQSAPSKPDVNAVTTSIAPITSTVRTTLGSKPQIQTRASPHTMHFTTVATQSPKGSDFDGYPTPASQTRPARLALVRNNDSGYSSSSYGSSHALTSTGRPSERSVQFQAASQPPASQQRPPLSSPVSSTPNRSYTSLHKPSSSESTTTTASLRDGAGTPLSPGSRRLKKLRPASLPPVARIPGQSQKVNYSSFIPPIPQDIAARHARRSQAHPPLAQTVPNVRHTRKASGSGIAPMSAPIEHPDSRGSHERGSHERRSNERRSTERCDDRPLVQPVEKPTDRSVDRPKERRSSKSFLVGRVLKFAGDSRQAPEPEINTAPCQMSQPGGKCRHANYNDEDVLTDLNEVGELYGASPYDAAAGMPPYGGSFGAPPQAHSYHSRTMAGMSEAQAAEVNRMREQSRWAGSMNERMASVPEQDPQPMPRSAPPADHHYANPYPGPGRWEHEPYGGDADDMHPYDGHGWGEDPYEPSIYDRYHYSAEPSPAISQHGWPAKEQVRHMASSTTGHRPLPRRRFSDRPPATPEMYGDEWAEEARRGSYTTPASPISPLEHEGDSLYAQLSQGNPYDVSGPSAAPREPEPGRYDGGYHYGYEPGRGINGSAGTRNWRSEAGRKNGLVGRQYGIDLTDVPIFVAPGRAT